MNAISVNMKVNVACVKMISINAKGIAIYSRIIPASGKRIAPNLKMMATFGQILLAGIYGRRINIQMLS